MSLAQLWEDPALPPPVTRAAISEGGGATTLPGRRKLALKSHFDH